tara:strand:+ start:646 stop:2451 length:1806 start_codon:yes stop_codon:yes gene_type:complete
VPGYRKKTVPISYTSRDYATIKNDLVQHVKRYYPDSFQDFSENSFGSLMLDTVSYVGDILSFYLDYSVNESFLTTAIEYDNVVKLSRQMGYTQPGALASTGILTFYILVTADSSGIEPDSRYMPLLKRGSKFTGNSGAIYTLTEDVDFANPSNEIVVATTNSTTGLPTKYAVRAFGTVISGESKSESHEIGDFQRFLKVDIDDTNITEVVSVIDSSGHKYHEVDYLTQNVIYVGTTNKSADKYQTPQIMKPMPVPRRYVVEHNRGRTSIQFGFGSDNNLSTDVISDPSNVILDVHGKNYVTDKSFDPTNLIKTDKLGVVPTNTTLTITYRKNATSNVNASTNAISVVTFADMMFENVSSLDAGEVNTTRASLECINEEPIVGNVTSPTSEELKYRAYGSFSSQNRAVTREDYKSLIYNMPARFGSPKRASVLRDANSMSRNLNIYVLSEDENRFLVNSNTTLKNNIKTWLSSYKMINDTIDILDGRVINIGITFQAVSQINVNKYEILERAKSELVRHFAQTKYDLGEPFRTGDVFKVLKNVEGILDVTDVTIGRKIGSLYSDYYYNLDANLTPDGRLIKIPEFAAYEIKYPNTDIVGTIL